MEHGEREWNQRSTGRQSGVKEKNVGMVGESGLHWQDTDQPAGLGDKQRFFQALSKLERCRTAGESESAVSVSLKLCYCGKDTIIPFQPVCDKRTGKNEWRVDSRTKMREGKENVDRKWAAFFEWKWSNQAEISEAPQWYSKSLCESPKPRQNFKASVMPPIPSLLQKDYAFLQDKL